MRFSVITPTIGRDSLIRACRSLDLQSHSDWQHLVVLDGTDWPQALVDQIRHPQRQLLQTGFQAGDSGNTPRRVARTHVTGDYVLYLDDDNYFARATALATMAVELEDVRPSWAIIPVLGGSIPRQPVPRVGAIDSGNIIHRPTVCGLSVGWPESPDYVADGQFAEELASLAIPYPMTSPAAIRYEQPLKGRHDSRPAVATAVDDGYFRWFRWWWHSVRDQVDWPLYAVDLGLALPQQHWCLEHGIALLRPDPRFRFLEHDRWLRNVWTCIRPALDLRSHARVLWCGCDTLLLRPPELLFREHFAVFRDHFAPEVVANPAELYAALPVDMQVDPACLPNAEVVSWRWDRDAPVLAAWREILDIAAVEEPIARLCQWGPQGALIWALHRAGCPERVIDNLHCNYPANGLKVRSMSQRTRYEDDPALIERVRTDHPQAVVVHWMGTLKPWQHWGPAVP